MEALQKPCKNECGFYGVEEWDGLCSQCHLKEDNPDSEIAIDITRNRQTSESGTTSGQSTPGKDSKFSFFKKAHKRSSSAGDIRVANDLSATIKGWLRGGKSREIACVDFLKTLRKPTAQDVVNQMKQFLNSFEAKLEKGMSATEQAEAVQNFYQGMESRMEYHSAWKNVEHEEQKDIMDGIERHIMTHLYDKIFHADPDDERRDLELQHRIRNLRWVTPKLLEAHVDTSDDVMLEFFHKAQEELITVDAKRAPQDKLQCIVACSKAVFELLKGPTGDSKAASADDFLPVLIYVTLQANPPLLYSNMQFVSRFCHPDKLQSGEAGYYYTNLFAAVSFIENLDGSSLKLSDTDFEKHMTGELSDQGLPEMKNAAAFRNSLERLRRLSARTKVLQEDMVALNEAIDRLCASAVNPLPNIHTISQSTPVSPKARRKADP